MAASHMGCRRGVLGWTIGDAERDEEDMSSESLTSGLKRTRLREVGEAIGVDIWVGRGMGVGVISCDATRFRRNPAMSA